MTGAGFRTIRKQVGWTQERLGKETDKAKADQARLGKLDKKLQCVGIFYESI